MQLVTTENGRNNQIAWDLSDAGVYSLINARRPGVGGADVCRSIFHISCIGLKQRTILDGRFPMQPSLEKTLCSGSFVGVAGAGVRTSAIIECGLEQWA